VHGPNYEGDQNPTPHVLSCQHCHAGAADYTFETMDEAHAGMFADPSAPGQSGCTACHAEDFARSACDQCHAEIVTATETSLHTTLAGYVTAIENRCGCEFADQGVDDFFDARCAGCHATCGQCHISRPSSVGGGFPKIGSLYSHRFRETPDMNEQCTACHGSRVGTDFRGELEGNVPDVHRTAGMRCEACHTADEIHGDGIEYSHRYEVAGMPRCENCHQDALASGFGHIHHTGQDPDCGQCHHNGGSNCGNCHNDGIAFGFAYPLPTMACQTCHSQPYKNCTNCHNLTDEGYDIEPSMVQLKIARNPSPHREEYDLAVVRHTPIDPETFANWGLDLPNYTDVSTWQYASPHNILRDTPQTAVEAGQSCFTACHGSASGPDGYLLRESDLYEADGTTPLVDYEANIGIVIPDDFPSR
jgi:thiosulfate/3-mercaptopyruvate sulfurtransferase